MIDHDKGMIAYYKHKSEGKYYCCQIPSWSCRKYDKDQYIPFLRDYGIALTEAATRGTLLYENYEVKIISDDVLRI